MTWGLDSFDGMGQNWGQMYAPQVTAQPPGGGGIMDWMKSSGMLGSYNDKGVMTGQGWGGMALGAANGIFNAYMGLKQYGLAKDQFSEARKQFGLNYDAERNTTNSALADRQAARIAANPNGGYASVADYMAKYGIPARG